MDLVVTNHVTLDSVMQAPAGADEDPRGGFEHGGWAAANADEVMGRAMGERMAGGGALLFGRRTYEKMAAFWPHQPADNPYAKAINEPDKYVASRTLRGAAGVGQRHPARRRRRRRRGGAQGAARREPVGPGQRRPPAVAHAPRPRRPVGAPHPPARARDRPAAVPRRRGAGPHAPDRLDHDDDRRRSSPPTSEPDPQADAARAWRCARKARTAAARTAAPKAAWVSVWAAEANEAWKA